MVMGIVPGEIFSCQSQEKPTKDFICSKRATEDFAKIWTWGGVVNGPLLPPHDAKKEKLVERGSKSRNQRRGSSFTHTVKVTSVKHDFPACQIFR